MPSPRKNQHHTIPRQIPRRSGGFSLIEILVVMAIIAVMATLAIPAFSSLGQARGVSEAGFQLAAAIEQARAEAVARNTYVWLGIDEATASGNRDLLLGIVYSKDGTANSAANNLQPVSRATVIKGVGIDEATSAPASATDLSGHSGDATFKIGQADFASGRTLLFSPTGEVALSAPAAGAEFRFEPLLSIGLKNARGTSFLDDKNSVDVLVDGSTGIPQIRRPQIGN